MWIRTLWVAEDDGDTTPWLVGAVDEYTWDEWGHEPDFYRDERVKHPLARQLVIEIDARAVHRLFEVPTVAGTAKEDGTDAP